jgi:uncharacterized protein YukJ
MPIERYGVLRGRAVDARRETGSDTPHYQIRIEADSSYRIAVNVKSSVTPPDLLFLIDEAFTHPVTASLTDLAQGFNALESRPGGAALDFIRANLFDRTQMRILPPNVAGPDNDLSDRVEHFVSRAIQDAGAEVFAFGQRWGPEDQEDKIFHFRPGNGIHDIHMNQGNDRSHRRDDGVWQDGGLLFHFPNPGQWVAIFLAFQSQAFHTDDRTGHALADGVPALGPANKPNAAEPDGSVRIVAALVNPVGPAPERETVTLINTTAAAVDLTGWRLLDRLKHPLPLSGGIEAGATRVVEVVAPVQLGNSGGLITLLNKDGLKVHGVSYTKAQASHEGETIVF